MQNLSLKTKNKIVLAARILLQLGFLLFLIFSKEPFENTAAFLVAMVAAEGYKVLGTMAISQNERFRDLIGLITGVLNGIIFMITVYLTGYVETEIWVFSALSIAFTALEYGIYGSIAEGFVMMSLYVVIGGIAGLDYSILLLRALVFVGLSAVYGYISNRELVYERRFEELDKRSKLTKDQKSRFVGLISHSLRTPITTIRGYIDLLRNERPGKLNKEQKELVGKLNAETEEIQDLIEDFLTVSTLEREHIKLDYDEFDICALGGEIYEEMLSQAEEKGVKFGLTNRINNCQFLGSAPSWRMR